MRGGGMRVCVPKMGLSFVGPLFKISFLPRGKLFGFGWFGLGVGSARSPPPPNSPPVDKHIPDVTDC